MLQLTTAVGALLGTYISLLAEGMGKTLRYYNKILRLNRLILNNV